MSNILSLDYGTKQIGIAVSVNGIISPLSVLPNNDNFLSHLFGLIKDHQISKIYVGVSEGKTADKTSKFVTQLRAMLQLEVETVEESVSTIEATQIYQANRKKKKNYKREIDALAAAVILRRVIS